MSDDPDLKNSEISAAPSILANVQIVSTVGPAGKEIVSFRPNKRFDICHLINLFLFYPFLIQSILPVIKCRNTTAFNLINFA